MIAVRFALERNGFAVDLRGEAIELRSPDSEPVTVITNGFGADGH
jgi:hypothetical protein